MEVFTVETFGTTCPHGKGKLISAEGDKFEGQFRYGRREGKGKLIRADGRVFEGEFKNDTLVKNK